MKTIVQIIFDGCMGSNNVWIIERSFLKLLEKNKVKHLGTISSL